MSATKFVPVHNIFTGQEVSNLKVVPIPDVHSKRKGTTLHDEKFHTLMKFDKALSVPEGQFDSVRKSLQRYLENRDLRKTVSIRQHKDVKTKSFTIWLVNEPPQVVIPRKGQKA